jgi:SAM-dependent methyltransferase
MSGFQAIGIDFAKETVNMLHTAIPGIDVRHGDVRSLPFADNSFAAYLSLGVIEHFWRGYDPILSEMTRVVNHGGYVFLTVPYMSPLRKMKALAGYYDTRLPEQPEKNFYQFALNARQVVKDFRASGFSLIQRNPMDGIKGFKDEVRFGRKWLQDVYDDKRRFRNKGRLSQFLSYFAGHMMLFVFRKTSKEKLK